MLQKILRIFGLLGRGTSGSQVKVLSTLRDVFPGVDKKFSRFSLFQIERQNFLIGLTVALNQDKSSKVA